MTVLIISLGWIGTILSQLYKIPQLIHTYKLKKAEDLSLLSIIIQTLSYIVWITYSVLVGDFFYILANCLSFSQNIILHMLKYHYRAKPSEKVEKDVIAEIV